MRSSDKIAPHSRSQIRRIAAQTKKAIPSGQNEMLFRIRAAVADYPNAGLDAEIGKSIDALLSKAAEDAVDEYIAAVKVAHNMKIPHGRPFRDDIDRVIPPVDTMGTRGSDFQSSVSTSGPHKPRWKRGQNVVGIGNLRVLVLQDKDTNAWFARGLEIDYAAQGDSESDVKDRFSKGLLMTIHENLKVYGSIEKLLKVAPQDVWTELYKSLPFDGITFIPIPASTGSEMCIIDPKKEKP